MKNIILKYQKYRNRGFNGLLGWIDYLWRKEYLAILFFLATLITIALILFGANLSDFILSYTGIVILWYTRETMDLKKISNKELVELRKQSITGIRPYLRLQKKAGENRLQLVNEGKGVAVNLKPVYKSDSEEKEMLKIPAMAAAPNSITESFAPARLGLELDPSSNSFTVEIKYEDIEKRKYVAIFKSNIEFNDGFEIVKQTEA